MARLTTAVILLLLSLSASAQYKAVPADCCTQAIELQKQLTKVTAQRDSLKAIGSRLLKAKDLRIEGLKDKGNERLAELATQIRQRDTRLELVCSSLTVEIIRSRFLGWGRRAWAKNLLKQLTEP